jgi:glycosyltransferase involved in cell wall biosynthesis
MKIAILSPFYPLRGGIAQFADALANELEKNHVVLRVSLKRQYPNALFPGKTQFVESPRKEDCKALAILDSIGPKTFGKTAKVINDFEPDLFIDVYWMTFMVPSFSTVLRKIKSRKIGIVHNFISHESKWYDKNLASYFLKKHDGLIALSAAVSAQIKTGLPNQSVMHIPHPIYSHFGEKTEKSLARQKLGIKEDEKLLLFFGLIRDYKGLDVLLEAFQDLDDTFTLIVAGECYGDISKYQKIVDQGSNKKVKFLNRFIADEEVPVLFSAANVCVLPYRSATQSGVTAVSHHFHLPVIASNVGGLHETIHQNENGYLVEANNVKSLRLCIQNYFEEKKESEFRQNLEMNISVGWESFINQLIEFGSKV